MSTPGQTRSAGYSTFPFRNPPFTSFILNAFLSSGNILKPSLDLVLFTSQLSRSLGVRGTILLFLNYYGTVAILRAVTPAFGRMAAIEARLEGEYRAGMGRVGREAEEVAFYDGGKRERDILTNAYMRLIKHVNSIYKVCLYLSFCMNWR